MLLVRLLCFIIICFGTSQAVHAKPYFPAETVPPTLLTPPLAPKSAAWNEEIETIIALQKHASKEEINAAASERDVHPERMLETLHPEITRASNPALFVLLDRVSDTSRVVTNQAKTFWSTKRPYLSDSRVKALIDAHSNNAYPSGHTSASYCFAYVLGMVFPKERQQFIDRAETIAQHRVLVGMHYPHDIKGGKQLADLIVGGLLQNAAFRKDLAKAQKESHTAD